MSRLDENCNTSPIAYVSGGNKDLGELKKNEFGTATIMISHSCNLHCTYCFEDCKEMGVHNNIDNIKAFVDAVLRNEYKELLDIDKIKFLYFEFFGGEPFLRIDLMEQTMDYVNEKLKREHSKFENAHAFYLVTNGTIFNDRVKEFIAKYAFCTDTTISLDGCKECHDNCRVFADGSGSYDIAESFTKWMFEQGYTIATRSPQFTIAPQNCHYFYEGIKNMYNLGFKWIRSPFVADDDWDKVDIKIINTVFKQGYDIINWIITEDITDIQMVSFLQNFGEYKDVHKVLAVCIDNRVCVDAYGDIYPCERFMSIVKNDFGAEPLCYGNVHSGFLKTESDKKHFQQYLDFKKYGFILPDKCKNCKLIQSCPVCFACHYKYNGDIRKKTVYHCIPHKLEYLWTWYFSMCRFIKYGTEFDESDIRLDELYLPEEEIKYLIGDDDIFNTYIKLRDIYASA